MLALSALRYRWHGVLVQAVSDVIGRRYRVTKADIVERLYERAGIAKHDAGEIVEAIFMIVKTRLEQGEKIKLSGFGNFEVRTKRARRGRNPQTGDAITISGRRILTFKASPLLKEAINKE
jgi:integration host factor subunit alpha